MAFKEGVFVGDEPGLSDSRRRVAMSSSGKPQVGQTLVSPRTSLEQN